MLIRPSAAVSRVAQLLTLNTPSKRYKLFGANRRGFTLVELAVVIVIIGVLAAFGVPRFMTAVEKAKAAEAYAALSAIRDAQERYQAANGTYATDLGTLDIQLSPPKYFTIGTVGPGATGNQQNSWSLSFTRLGASAGYGAYTVIFTDQGFDTVNSTIPTQISPAG